MKGGGRKVWIGIALIAVTLLLLLRDKRLLALLPVLALIFFVVAPARVTDRVESIFNLKNPTNLDRLVMMRYGIDDVRLFHSADLRFLSQFR